MLLLDDDDGDDDGGANALTALDSRAVPIMAEVVVVAKRPRQNNHASTKKSLCVMTKGTMLESKC